jgi:hypothetical protein
MMERLFDKVAQRHDEIVKAAFIGTILGAAGKAMLRNPLRTLGGVFDAQQAGSVARSSAKNMAGQGIQAAAPALANTF